MERQSAYGPQECGQPTLMWSQKENWWQKLKERSLNNLQKHQRSSSEVEVHQSDHTIHCCVNQSGLPESTMALLWEANHQKETRIGHNLYRKSAKLPEPNTVFTDTEKKTNQETEAWDMKIEVCCAASGTWGSPVSTGSKKSQEDQDFLQPNLLPESQNVCLRKTTWRLTAENSTTCQNQTFHFSYASLQ